MDERHWEENNTAVAGLQCMVNAMTVTHFRSRFRHQDTNVHSTLKGLWLTNKFTLTDRLLYQLSVIGPVVVF